ALHKGRNTISKTIETPPEEEFFVNQPITVGKHDAVIYRIKTKDDIIKDGSAKAEDIRRIYAKMMR
ncbi:MAG: HVO_0476 family zinc finger protein, partial [Thermoplasmata archaeon]